MKCMGKKCIFALKSMLGRETDDAHGITRERILKRTFFLISHSVRQVSMRSMSIVLSTIEKYLRSYTHRCKIGGNLFIQV